MNDSGSFEDTSNNNKADDQIEMQRLQKWNLELDNYQEGDL